VTHRGPGGHAKRSLLPRLAGALTVQSRRDDARAIRRFVAAHRHCSYQNDEPSLRPVVLVPTGSRRSE
jgi:hypothetical protein